MTAGNMNQSQISTIQLPVRVWLCKRKIHFHQFSAKWFMSGEKQGTQQVRHCTLEITHWDWWYKPFILNPNFAGQTGWRPKCELPAQHQVVENRMDSVSLCPTLWSRRVLPVLDNTSPQASSKQSKLELINKICMIRMYLPADNELIEMMKNTFVW